MPRSMAPLHSQHDTHRSRWKEDWPTARRQYPRRWHKRHCPANAGEVRSGATRWPDAARRRCCLSRWPARRGAAVVQGAVGIIIGPLLRGVEINDAVVERRRACSAAVCSSGRITGQRAVIEEGRTCPTTTEVRWPIAGQRAVVERGACAPPPLRMFPWPNCCSTRSCSAVQSYAPPPTASSPVARQRAVIQRATFGPPPSP